MFKLQGKRKPVKLFSSYRCISSIVSSWRPTKTVFDCVYIEIEKADINLLAFESKHHSIDINESAKGDKEFARIILPEL